MRAFRGVAVVAACVLVVSMLPGNPAVAGPVPREVVPVARSTDRVPLSKPSSVAPHAPQTRLTAAPRPASWPAPGSSTVDIPAATGTRSEDFTAGDGTPPARPVAQVGKAPLWLSTVDGRAATARVEVLDPAVSGRDLALRVGAGTPVRLTVDVSGFADAYGANWVDRLSWRVVDAGGHERRLAGTRDGTMLSAEVPADRTVVALAADPSSPVGSGDYGATSLSPSATWSAGGNSGAFTWSYPMRVPPSLGGPTPNVALSYNSQSVDGRGATDNAQPSWAGEGFDWTPGYIERRYVTCQDDMAGSSHNNTSKTGDLCWRSSNAVLSLNGHGGELIYNATEKLWHTRAEDGSKIQHLTGAANGDTGSSSVDGVGEYWLVTTNDGTKYYFGLNRLDGWTSGKPVTNSTLTVPVYGNDAGEPCFASGSYATSSCTQAYRWMLDYVVDPHGNTMSLWWNKDTNMYGRNMSESSLAGYDRDAYLDHIDYGTHQRTLVNGVRTDTEYLTATIPMQVKFGAADRCLTSCGTQSSPTKANWFDTPWDLSCSAAPCDDHSPAFYSSRRLATVTTRVWDTGLGKLRDVEQWSLTHSFPDPSDGTKPGLWLDTIKQTGLVGGSAAMNPIRFTPIMLDNRVDTTLLNGLRPFRHARINLVTTESGETININYAAPDCSSSARPVPEANTQRCYPVRWAPEDLGGTPGQEITDWFHKYVVDNIIETDATGPIADSPNSTTTKYVYLNGAAWHYADDDGLTKAKYLTWNQWRGYDTVRTLVGTGADQIRSEQRFFRGMNGDRTNASGGSKTVSLSDSKGLLGPAVPDENEYAGQALETWQYSSPTGTPLSGGVDRPWRSAPTATRLLNGQTVDARYVNVADRWTWSALDGGRADRVTHTHADYDSLGMSIASSSDGDTAVTGDEQCALTEYARDTTANRTVYPKRERSFAVTCAVAMAAGHVFTPAEVVSEKRTYYDGQAWGAAPTEGNVTQVDSLKDWVNNTFVPVTVEKSTYDSYGRVTATWDVDNLRTGTTYVPAADAPVTSVVTEVPTPTGLPTWSTTTTVEPAWGWVTATVDENNRRTDVTYDPLGRRTAVWMPGHARASYPTTPNKAYVYTISNTAPSVVETRTLTPNGTQLSSFQFYDALLRPRQTQQALASGAPGRKVSDTFYDTAGRVWRTYGPYVPLDTGGPSANLSPLPADNFDHIDMWTRTLYDPAGRKTADVEYYRTVERVRTSYAHPSGDRVDATAPPGGISTSTVSDAEGRVTQLRQHHSRTSISTDPSTYDASVYVYDPKGQLTTLTSAAGVRWGWQYDIQGRQTVVDDPDKGRTSITYNDDDSVKTTNDGRGVTLAYGYDSIGRKNGLYRGSVAPANLLASWAYDEIPGSNGMVTSSARYLGGAAGTVYRNLVTALAANGQPSQTKVVIPDAETGLGGTYQYDLTYKQDGSLATQRLPAIGGSGGLGFETQTISYNGVGLPQKMSTGATSWIVSDTTYTDLGELSTVTMRDSLTSPLVMLHRDYDPATRRLNHLWTTRDTAPTVVTDTTVGFDAIGNVTSLTENAALAGVQTQCFGYDWQRRLTQAWTPANGNCAVDPAQATMGGPAPYWTIWDVDAEGKRTKQTEKLASNGVRTTSYTYAGHQLAGTSKVDNAGTVTTSYTYDGAGNTATRGGKPVQWDEEGRFAGLTETGGDTQVIYDADGDRLIRKDPGGKTLYLRNQELRVSKAGDTVLSCTRYYSWQDMTVAQRSNTGGLTWLSPDRQGTANVSIAATSQAIAVRRQDPYGNARGVGSGTWPSTMDKGYLGGTSDAGNLVHLGAREYDPALGRFLSPDPAFDERDPQTWTSYTYAANSPVVLTDANGMRACDPDDPGGCQVSHAPQPKKKATKPKSESPWDVINTKVYKHHTVLKHYRNGTITINGLVIPPGCKDPYALAEKVDEYWGEGGLKDPVLDHFDSVTAFRTNSLMERACWSVGCTREFVSAVHQAGTDILATADTSSNEAKFWHAMKYVALYGSGAVCLVASAGTCAVAIVAALGTATAVNVYEATREGGFKYKQFFISEGIDLITALASLYGAGGAGLPEDLNLAEEISIRSIAFGSAEGMTYAGMQWEANSEVDAHEHHGG